MRRIHLYLGLRCHYLSLTKAESIFDFMIKLQGKHHSTRLWLALSVGWAVRDDGLRVKSWVKRTFQKLEGPVLAVSSMAYCNLRNETRTPKRNKKKFISFGFSAIMFPSTLECICTARWKGTLLLTVKRYEPPIARIIDDLKERLCWRNCYSYMKIRWTFGILSPYVCQGRNMILPVFSGFWSSGIFAHPGSLFPSGRRFTPRNEWPWRVHLSHSLVVVYIWGRD